MSPDTFRATLAAEAARLRVDVLPEQLDALCVHYERLRAWNRRIRLAGTVEPERAAVELFADSLRACAFAGSFFPDRAATAAPRALKVIDIGAGAGLPGIPAKIMQPEWHLTLVDSNAKKIAFLKSVCRDLHMNDIQIQRRRAEALAHEPAYRERFDIAFCRAVAAPVVACELAIPFLVKNGSFILQTSAHGNNSADEKRIEAVRTAAGRLNATIDETRTYDLSTAAEKRMLLRIRKAGTTPREFPREFKKMKERPCA